MQFISTTRGRSLTVFTAQEVRDHVAIGRSPLSFQESPARVMSLKGWSEPLYAHSNSPMDGDIWANHFPESAASGRKPGFDDIYTLGLGELTGAEVREQERLAGIAIDDSTAVRAYNAELELNHSLFGAQLGHGDLVAQLEPEDFERLEVVEAGVESILEAKPVYFSVKTDKVLDEEIILTPEGFRIGTIKEVDKVPTIGVAFPGPHALVRDVFDLTQFLGGGPNPAAAGVPDVKLPGRDRWHRFVGVNVFWLFLCSPIILLSSTQVRQRLEGRPVTMPHSPIVPPQLWSR